MWLHPGCELSQVTAEPSSQGCRSPKPSGLGRDNLQPLQPSLQTSPQPSRARLYFHARCRGGAALCFPSFHPSLPVKSAAFGPHPWGRSAPAIMQYFCTDVPARRSTASSKQGKAEIYGAQGPQGTSSKHCWLHPSLSQEPRSPWGCSRSRRARSCAALTLLVHAGPGQQPPKNYSRRCSQ